MICNALGDSADSTSGSCCAFAENELWGIGGWWLPIGENDLLPNTINWFSLQDSRKDLPMWLVEGANNLQSITASLEALAQLMLMTCRCRAKENHNNFTRVMRQRVTTKASWALRPSPFHETTALQHSSSNELPHHKAPSALVKGGFRWRDHLAAEHDQLVQLARQLKRLPSWLVEGASNLQSIIASLEALAQLALLTCRCPAKDSHNNFTLTMLQRCNCQGRNKDESFWKQGEGQCQFQSNLSESLSKPWSSTARSLQATSEE
jgi:hypothetical protein